MSDTTIWVLFLIFILLIIYFSIYFIFYLLFDKKDRCNKKNIHKLTQWNLIIIIIGFIYWLTQFNITNTSYYFWIKVSNFSIFRAVEDFIELWQYLFIVLIIWFIYSYNKIKKNNLNNRIIIWWLCIIFIFLTWLFRLIEEWRRIKYEEQELIRNLNSIDIKKYKPIDPVNVWK